MSFDGTLPIQEKLQPLGLGLPMVDALYGDDNGQSAAGGEVVAASLQKQFGRQILLLPGPISLLNGGRYRILIKGGIAHNGIKSLVGAPLQKIGL